MGRGGGWRAGAGGRGGGGGREEERRRLGPPPREQARVECEAVAGGEQGGEGDQALAAPGLAGRAARGGAAQ